MNSTTTANTTTKSRTRRSRHSARSPATQITTSGGPSSTSSRTHMPDAHVAGVVLRQGAPHPELGQVVGELVEHVRQADDER